MCRTYVVGKASNQQNEMWYKFRDTQCAVLEKVRPGVRTSELYNIYREKFEKYGLPLANFVGHGLGVLLHEEPLLGGMTDYVLEEGMVICVEPFLFGDNEGYQLEDEIVVTADGYKLITDVTPIEELIEII